MPNNWRSIFGGSTWEPVPNEPGLIILIVSNLNNLI